MELGGFSISNELWEGLWGLQPSCVVWADMREGWRGPRGKNLLEKVCPGPLHLPLVELRYEITPMTLQKCLFPVTLARHSRQQLGHLSFYLLPPVAPRFRSGISLARFPRLWFMVSHVSCSCTGALLDVQPSPRVSAQKPPIKSARGKEKAAPGAPEATVTYGPWSQENLGETSSMGAFSQAFMPGE